MTIAPQDWATAREISPEACLWSGDQQCDRENKPRCIYCTRRHRIATALVDQRETLERERDNARRTIDAQNTVIAGLIEALEDRDFGSLDPLAMIGRLQAILRRDDE